jgi:hypothetical protein
MINDYIERIGVQKCEKCGSERPLLNPITPCPCQTVTENIEPREEVNLTQEFDGRVWAKEFMRIVVNSGKPIDEEWIFGWFANAIMAGYDNHRWKHEGEIKLLMEKIDEWIADRDSWFERYKREHIDNEKRIQRLTEAGEKIEDQARTARSITGDPAIIELMERVISAWSRAKEALKTERGKS